MVRRYVIPGNAVLAAMCTGDAIQMQDAQEFLKETELAAKQYLASYDTVKRVEQAWKKSL
jgi:hypothetical protein